jgi:hypothetical protein
MTVMDFMAAKAERNMSEASPEEIIALIAKDLKDGRIKNIKRMMIILAEEPDDGSYYRFERYSSGMNLLEEVGFIELAKDQCLRDQLEGHD